MKSIFTSIKFRQNILKGWRFEFFMFVFTVWSSSRRVEAYYKIGVSTTAVSVTKLIEASWYMSYPIKKMEILRDRGDGEREAIK